MNAVYPKARETLLTWALDDSVPAGGADGLFLIGVKNTYVYGAAHSSLADVAPADIVIPESVLSNVTVTDGIIDADTLALTGIVTGPTCSAFIIYGKWGATSLLLLYIDSAADASLPQELSTSKLNIEWPAEGIGRI